LCINSETPARRILKGEVDLCVAPTESVISCWTSEVNKTRPVAVAALLQQDSSAIVSLASGPVKILSDLGNHRYASYGGRFEMAIVKQMIAINGGNPSTLVDLQPPKLDCFDAVIRGEAEATWIFTAWEGIMAKYKGIDLNAFPLKASNIPYGYSPVLLAHPDMLVGDKSELLKKFLKVCQKSYEFCVSNPDEAAKLLFQQANHKSLYDLGLPFVTESQQYLSTVNQGYLDSQGRWGMMDPKRWTDFIDWLCDNQCLTNRDGEVIPR
jgi:NitT/TauT family transport system substrate-binding protein